MSTTTTKPNPTAQPAVAKATPLPLAPPTTGTAQPAAAKAQPLPLSAPRAGEIATGHPPVTLGGIILYNFAGIMRAAIVSGVHPDGKLDITAFLPDRGGVPVTKVAYSDKALTPGTWAWPPRAGEPAADERLMQGSVGGG